MLISETHFTKKTYLKIHNFTIYDTKHADGAAHGGSAIIIKNKLKHYVLPEFLRDYLQATSICLQELRGNINISAIYKPISWQQCNLLILGKSFDS